MKKVIIAGMLLALCSTGFCQTDDPGCNLYATQKDTTCVSTSTCATATNCPRTQFTIVCPTDVYWIKAYTDCDGTNNAHCAACVKITDMSGTPLFQLNTEAECEEVEYCDSASWTPTSSGTYYLSVCLVPCNEVDGETCCGGQYDCEAWGIISKSQLSCD